MIVTSSKTLREPAKNKISVHVVRNFSFSLSLFSFSSDVLLLLVRDRMVSYRTIPYDIVPYPRYAHTTSNYGTSYSLQKMEASKSFA